MEPEVISSLISTSSGDLRRAITYLQSASRLSSSTNPPTKITSLDIQEIAGVVPDDIINNFATSLGIECDTNMDVDTVGRKKTGFEVIRKEVKALMRDGYSASQILSQVISLSYVSQPY
jgi:replication factor C subunit 2/4